MATKQIQAPANPNATPNLSATLDIVAKDKGIDRAVLVQTLESAILSAARKHLGGTRDLVARFNDRDGGVDLFQRMTVVDVVTQPEQEISLGRAAELNLDVEKGDMLEFQVFYRPEDGKKAEEQEGRFGDLLLLQSARKGFGRIAAQAAKQVIIQRVRDARARADLQRV
jgi:N utilization substance protein A